MEKIKMMLDENANMRKFLFSRGFLMTDNKGIDTKEYPFYDEWIKTEVLGYTFLVHSKQKYTQVIEGDLAFVLIGHAYEPVNSCEYCENKLLDKLLEYYKIGEYDFLNYFNCWTGMFALFVITDKGVRIFGDAAGMQTVFYGFNEDFLYVSSHAKLLGDICGLEMSEYVKDLTQYRFYSLFGKSLPGDISPYDSFKRLIPNHCVAIRGNKIEIKRFFPLDDKQLSDLEYSKIIERITDVMKNSMSAIHKKWDRCAISLTGGCDSKTTLSCATDCFEKYNYFSYVSRDEEEVDAKAASEICKILGISHEIYEIPSDDSDFPDIEVYRSILEHSTGGLGKNNPKDVRKRAFFAEKDYFDVEVKSWVSEIGRAYYHKRFAKTKLPSKVTAKYAMLIYKVFIHNRKLKKQTVQIFQEYIEKYCSDGIFKKIPWYDIFFWEFRVSSWNGWLMTGKQQLSYDITIPYNNRELLWLFLSTPLEKRINDTPHFDVIQKMNTSIYDCGISVTNVKHTKRRAKLERLYIDVFSKLPL